MSDPFSLIPRLYHFTDRRNLPLIRAHGGLHPLAHLRRKRVTVPAPGGNQWSQDADGYKGMDQYVHLCFRSSHPMEFVARQEGRITDSIFLEVHPAVLHFPDVKFAADVSNKSGVIIHEIAEARNLIDYQVLYTRTDWSDPVIQQRLRQAEKCEVLVPQCIPLSHIRNIPNG